MSNNKQSSVDILCKKLAMKLGGLAITFYIDHEEEIAEAKAKHKKETIYFALHCMMPNMEPDKATIEVVSDIYDEVFGGDQ